jgi:stearoyl-CoA desaturase (Delta-9 desaturase)
MEIFIFFWGHWYLSLFTQTFFYHRYAAHQMFTMSRTAEKFFMVMSFILQGSSYLSPRTYALLHRLHHAYADTEKDPHSPSFSTGFFDMMWKTKNIYNDILNDRYPIEDKFKKNLIDSSFIDKIGDSWYVRIGWGVLYSVFYIQFATHWWMYLLLPIHFLMGPVHGAIINWFAHIFGYVNHKVGDTAKNLLPVDFLMLGESYHNNHHKFGGRANFGTKWHEIDPVYPMIWILDKIGIIKLKLNNDLKYM